MNAKDFQPKVNPWLIALVATNYFAVRSADSLIAVQMHSIQSKQQA